jgi:hypothetical protein
VRYSIRHPLSQDKVLIRAHPLSLIRTLRLHPLTQVKVQTP